MNFMQHFYSRKAILQLAEEATQKLCDVQYTTRHTAVLRIISSIIGSANRFEGLTRENRIDVQYLCFKLNAHLNVTRMEEIEFVLSSHAPKDVAATYRRAIKEFSEIFQIGSDWLTVGISFNFPSRIDAELIPSYEQILRSNKTKLMTFNFIPIELGSFIPFLDNIRINPTLSSDFELSLITLQHFDIRPDQKLDFGTLHLDSQRVSGIILKYITSLYEAHGVTVFIFAEWAHSV